MSATTVRVGMVLLVVASTAVLWYRTASGTTPAPDLPNTASQQPAPGAPRRWATYEPVVLLVVTLAIAAVMMPYLFAHLQRRADDPFASIALSGQWALVTGPLPISGPVAIDVDVHNGTPTAGRWSVQVRTEGESDWPAAPLTVDAGAERTATITGTVPASGCLRKLTIALDGVDASIAPAPLVLYFGDPQAPRCAAG